MPTLRSNVAVTAASQAAGLSRTVSGITPAGTNRIGFVKVCYFTAATIDTVTWGGVNIASNIVKDAVHDGANRKRAAWFYYLDPPASSADIVVTTGASTTKAIIVEAWDGVDQGNPYANLTYTADATQQTNSTWTMTVTAPSGKVISDFLYSNSNSGAPAGVSGVGADQTLVWGSLDDYGGGTNSAYVGSSYATSDGSVDMSWVPTWTTSWQWVMYAIALNSADITPKRKIVFVN